MNDPRFEKVEHHLSELFRLEDEALKQTEVSIREAGMPEHSISPLQGQLLFQLASMTEARTIIEVGSLAGYSTIWLGRALPSGGRLVSIEREADYAELARINIEKAGLSDQVEIRSGSAMEVLKALDLGSRKVDLFFMDADKPNYVNYLDWALEHSRKGSVIAADNVIREGNILEQHSKDEKVMGVKNYLEKLSTHPRLLTSIIPWVGIKSYDGMAVSMVK